MRNGDDACHVDSAVAGMVETRDLEVGYSARNVAESDGFVGALDAFKSIDTTAAHVRRAIQTQRLLAQRGQRRRRIPDVLIAAAAEELGVGVLHYDADFDLIAAVIGQALRVGSWTPAAWTNSTSSTTPAPPGQPTVSLA